MTHLSLGFAFKIYKTKIYAGWSFFWMFFFSTLVYLPKIEGKQKKNTCRTQQTYRVFEQSTWNTTKKETNNIITHWAHIIWYAWWFQSVRCVYVHSSIPTISNGDSVTRKGIYLQKILEKTHIQAHNTRHRKRRTSFQRKNQSAMNVCECLR